MVDPTMSWFEFFNVSTFDLGDVTCRNDEYIDISFSRVKQLFTNTWLIRYPRPRKVVFDKRYKLEQDFTTFLKDFYIKPVLKKIKNPQDNALVDKVHQLILNVLVTKGLDNKVFDCIYTWVKNLAYIVCSIKDSYHCTILSTVVVQWQLKE